MYLSWSFTEKPRLKAYEPGATNEAGTEQHVDDWIWDAVEVSQALDEYGHVVFLLPVIVVEKMVDVEQIVHEVRTPAKYERWNHVACDIGWPEKASPLFDYSYLLKRLNHCVIFANQI